ncbi:MAG: hypothetical protein QX196_09525 [Methylococcaceae bacterium]
MVIETEIAKQEVVAWFRNVDRKHYSFCLPYEYKGNIQAMFPDFIVIRQQEDEFVFDILEPHSPGLADSAAKAVGLAKFASKHSDQFGRIELIRVEGQHIKRLDVNNNHHRQKVLAVSSNQHLDELFKNV